MKVRTKCVAACCCVVFLVVLACPVVAQKDAGGRVSVLVHMAPDADKQACRQFARNKGGTVKFEYRLLPNVINLTDIPVNSLEDLRSAPGVVKVEPDELLHEQLNDSTPLMAGLQSQLQAAGVTKDGTGSRVCVIDSGVNTQHDLYKDRIDFAASIDLFDNDPDPQATSNHGPHVSGIAVGGTGFLFDAGGGNGPESLQGVAPGATLISVRAGAGGLLGGGFPTSIIIAAIDHCTDPTLPNGPADVINLSLGSGLFNGPCTTTLAQAANAAVADGVVVVAASGNDGEPNGIVSPACGADVIAVGATSDDDYPNAEFGPEEGLLNSCRFSFELDEDDIACFSNGGAQLDLTAPGGFIVSAASSGQTSTAGLSGTSMASPQVAGLVALILSIDPGLTPEGVRTLLHECTVDLGAPGFDTTFGHGRINVLTAAKLASSCIVDSDCDDGRFCNGLEACVAGNCVLSSNPCAGQFCDDVVDACVPCIANQQCDDGLLCNGRELCDSGVCIPGTGTMCSGTVACDPMTNTCGSCADNFDCNDLDPCTGFESCDGQCVVDIADCNFNGRQDSCDLSDGTSVDVDPVNGIPDECDALIQFTFTEIPTLGGASNHAHGINEFDVVVGESATAGGLTRAFQFDDGILIDLGTLGGPNSVARSINVEGSAAGTSDEAAAFNQPTQWFVGAPPFNMGLIPGAVRADAFDIVLNSVAAGTSFDSLNNPTATRWTGATPIDVFAGSSEDPFASRGFGTNIGGDIVGWMDINKGACGPTPTRRSFLRKGGGPTIIEIAPLLDQCAEGSANAINDDGFIVGEIDSGIETHAFLADAFVFFDDLGTLGGPFASASAINRNNLIVGESDDPAGDRHAFLFRDTQMFDLNDHLVNSLGWTLVTAEDINTLSRIVGLAERPSGELRGYLLTPCGGLDFDPCPNQPCTINADCDDGLFCNGVESCGAGGTCQSSAPVNCSDGVGCTIDSCNESTDSCDNVASDAACSDGLFCNGSETCNSVLDCQSGPTVNCDDGVVCTDDSCNEATDSCDNIANDSNCDDGLFCNGTESCNSSTGCQAGSDPCAPLVCDEVVDQCVGGCDNDGTCEGGEDCNNCSNDCFSGAGASCGNGICEAGDGEDCLSCASDCNGTQGGKPANRFCCGDGDGQNPVGCSDSRCSSGGFMCTTVPAAPSCCGDTICEGTEDSNNCAVDCGPAPFCGDGICDPNEDECNCATDCGAPPSTETSCTNGVDDDCDNDVDCDDADCASDPICQSACDNDGICESGEDCMNCANDCEGKLNGNPGNRFCCGNGVLEGPEGNGSVCDGNP